MRKNEVWFGWALGDEVRILTVIDEVVLFEYDSGETESLPIAEFYTQFYKPLT